MKRRSWALLLVSVIAIGSVGWQASALHAGESVKHAEAAHWKPLTPEEERVIVNRGTEPAFSGAYWNQHEKGTYTCKRCGARLFSSKAKFDSGTGWPSFDDALPGAVRQQPDPDTLSMEIVCASCGGHLGHVFKGEAFTPKETRHCVNSVALDFLPASKDGGAVPASKAGSASKNGNAALTKKGKASTEEAFFAGGCFWGVEYWLEKEPGVSAVESGFMGGRTRSPSYEQVTTGTTGAAETVRVVFDPSKTSYEKLARVFFEIHDPTEVNRQGPDVGNQYRSAVFYANEGQKRVVEKLIGELRTRGYDVATEVVPASAFTAAEKYHQDYYVRQGSTPYCHKPTKRFAD